MRASLGAVPCCGLSQSMTSSAHNPALEPSTPREHNAEAARAGLLPADSARDASEREGASYLLLGESPIEVWRRPMSQRLAKLLGAEGLSAWGGEDTAPTAPVALLRADHFFDRAAAFVLLSEAPCVMTMPGPDGRGVPVAAYRPASPRAHLPTAPDHTPIHE